MAFLSEILSRRVPVILQSEAPECGIACLAMVASYHGHRTDLSAMRLRLSPSLKGITLKHVAQIAETMGMTARGVQVPLESLGKLFHSPQRASPSASAHFPRKRGKTQFVVID